VKPDTDASGAAEVDRHRRSVRLFLALQLAAVVVTYAVALTVGGGFAGPPMPPITVTMTSPPVAPTTRALDPALSSEQPFSAAVLPAWTRRPEVPAPWDSR
jgi:hypothetical protein